MFWSPWNKQWKALFCVFCQVYALSPTSYCNGFIPVSQDVMGAFNSRSGGNKCPFDACEPSKGHLTGLAVVHPWSSATRVCWQPLDQTCCQGVCMEGRRCFVQPNHVCCDTSNPAGTSYYIVRDGSPRHTELSRHQRWLVFDGWM